MRRKHSRWLWALVLCLLVGSALPILYTTRAARTAPLSAEQRTKESQPAGVSCLGRIEPEDGVVHVAAPYLFGRPGLVKLLHAREGDRVRQGQLLAVLEGRDQLQASLEQAQARIAVVRRRLELVKAGPKSGDVSAQRAEIARLEANLQNAQGEFNRYETLRRTDDVTVSEVEAKRTAMLTAQRSVETAQNRLQSLLEIRQADIDLAEAELQSAIADEQRARRDFEMSVVHAPMAGQVLKIHARAGEEVGPKGLLELGRTDRMYAVAEVYETDIARVRKGQRATISSDLLTRPLEGTVERVGMKVTATSLLPGDPSSFSDNRVIDVKVRLDDGRAVSRLIDGKVAVVIHP